MSLNPQDVHNELNDFCGQNAGIAISRILIEKLFNDQIARTTARMGSPPGNSDFLDLPLTYETTVTTAGSQLSFSNEPNPDNPDESFPAVDITGLNVHINVQLDGKIIGEVTFEYTKIFGRIIFIDKQLKISMMYENHNASLPVFKWETDPIIKEDFENNHNFNESNWDQLKHRIIAIEVFAATDIARAFFDALELPDLLSTFVGVKFGNDAKIQATTDFIMFTASSTINLTKCPVFPVDGETVLETKAQLGEGNQFKPGEGNFTLSDNDNPEDLKVSVELKANAPARTYPSERYGIGGTENTYGHVFFYTPLELLEHNFDGVVKPAVNASGRGSFGPIYWRYSLTAALRFFSINLVDTWPITFELKTPLNIFGQAGAGVKIGCVRYEAVGAMFEGVVDPFTTDFRIIFDGNRAEIVFESRIAEIKGRDFFFKSFPNLGFPISNIIDALLGRIAEDVITDQADRVLKVTRIPLARMSVLDRIAPINRNAFSGHADNAGNATFGIDLNI